MNVGIVTAWYDGGAGMVSRAYRQTLSSAHDVYIYARGGIQPKEDPKWNLREVTWGRQFQRGITRIALREFRRWALGRKLDVIIFNEQWDFIPVVYARRETDAAIGAYVDYYKADTVRFFDLYDFLLCNTKRHYSVFKEHPGAVYIPWGTDCEVFTGDCQPASAESVVFFLSAGGNADRKGAGVALKAFKQLKGPCRFVLHLQHPLAKYPDLEPLCGDDPRVEVIVRTEPAPGLYHLGDVYVYPTVLEGIGLTICEAMACGLPVITTDCPPMNEFVEHGINGRLVRPYEYRGRTDGYYWAESYCKAEDVAQAMQYYVDHRESIRDMKRQARQYAREHRNWASNAATLPGILTEFATSPRRREELEELEWRALDKSYLPPMRRNLRDCLRLLGASHSSLAHFLLYSV